MSSTIGLSEAERLELSRRATSRSGRADDGRRARLILLLAAGHGWAQIRDKLDCNDAFIDRWSKRFRRERVAGLFSRHAGRGPSKLTPALEARILDWTLKRKPADGSTHWSTRKLGLALSISHMMVARVWVKHGLKPQRLDRYMASNDPDFERKAADIIGLYVNPPAHAAVFCVDEKTAIQVSIARTRSCRCPQAGQSGTALSTTDTARCRCTPRSTPKPAKCWAKLRRGTLRRSLSLFWQTSSSTSQQSRRSM